MKRNMIISGDPGTGKTCLANGIVDLFDLSKGRKALYIEHGAIHKPHAFINYHLVIVDDCTKQQIETFTKKNLRLMEVAKFIFITQELIVYSPEIPITHFSIINL
jgi:hypothetical protein